MTFQNSELFERAACMAEPEALFVSGAAQHQAKLVCRACPVVMDCLAEALDRREEYGVWGGMTERERRALLRRRPHIDSWRNELIRMHEGADRGARRLALV